MGLTAMPPDLDCTGKRRIFAQRPQLYNHVPRVGSIPVISPAQMPQTPTATSALPAEPKISSFAAARTSL